MEYTILVVDDNDLQRYSVVRTLKSAGFQVVEAHHGTEALQKARQGVDLVILDINLPDIDGFEVCKRLKSDPSTNSIPVLHLTATYLRTEDKVKGLEGGADGYLTQPVKPAELIATSHALIRMKKAETSLQKMLHEKELLIQELYHRARNNMQVIASLLQLYSDRCKDPKGRAVLKEIEAKIHVMALAHQKLYESENPSYVNLHEYLKDITLIAPEADPDISSRTTISYQGEAALVLVDTAIPLGLAVHEFLTNAIRHAFPNGKRGQIDVHLRKGLQGEISIVIQDNGVGLPQDFSIEKHGKLGLSLAATLIQNQLGGKLTYESKRGTTWHIEIDKELYTPRV